MALFSRKAAPDWSAGDDPEAEAKCRKFPTPHTKKSDPWFHDMNHARDICNGTNDGAICPMRSSCLTQAMVNCERNGVWGGLGQHELAFMRKKYRRHPEKWQRVHSLLLTLAEEKEKARD
ncbi:WhiB family transcriptional regulator [Streptomyces sp. NPDC045456]|uniref:WhiB family transcriptional regulator n=1 Tax=Streptomyces sp. NPDC045456 TaxID=3155254 RepID=UPI0033DA3F57